MTALDVDLKASTYSQLLDDYLASRQFKPAFQILEKMSPDQIAFARFLHACLMREKGLPRTGVGYSLMIRGYGKRGNLNDAHRMTEQMEADGFRPSADSMCGLLDAHMIIKDLDGCMRVVEMMRAKKYKMSLLRTRKLIHALCETRRVEDAFLIFNDALENGVESDMAIYNDLIDLASLCHCPQRILAVLNSLEKRGIRPDYTRSHTLIYLLSQVDCLSQALMVLSRLPMGTQRANIESYMELISASFRAGLAEEAMRLLREYLSISLSKKRPLYFFNFALRGFRFLKDAGSAGIVYELIRTEPGLEPDYDTYREYMSCLLEARRFRAAIEVYNKMMEKGMELQRDLVNVYVIWFSASVNGDYHERAWDMYTSQVAKGRSLEPAAHLAMFDSCVNNARLSKILHVGRQLENEHVDLGNKRLEHMKRARLQHLQQTSSALSKVSKAKDKEDKAPHASHLEEAGGVDDEPQNSCSADNSKPLPRAGRKLTKGVSLSPSAQLRNPAASRKTVIKTATMPATSDAAPSSPSPASNPPSLSSGHVRAAQRVDNTSNEADGEKLEEDRPSSRRDEHMVHALAPEGPQTVVFFQEMQRQEQEEEQDEEQEKDSSSCVSPNSREPRGAGQSGLDGTRGLDSMQERGRGRSRAEPDEDEDEEKQQMEEDQKEATRRKPSSSRTKLRDVSPPPWDEWARDVGNIMVPSAARSPFGSKLFQLTDAGTPDLAAKEAGKRGGRAARDKGRSPGRKSPKGGKKSSRGRSSSPRRKASPRRKTSTSPRRKSKSPRRKASSPPRSPKAKAAHKA